MQHVINIAFDFDDRSISDYVERHAKDDIRDTAVAEIMDQIRKSGLPTRPYPASRALGAKGPSVDWHAVVQDRVDHEIDLFLDDHAQDVIDEAALLVARRVERRKSWRETLADVHAEADGTKDGDE